MEIVPPYVGEAAERLLDFIKDDPVDDPATVAFRAYLQKLIDAPHYVPTVNPWVVVSFHYSRYRQGYFTSEARIPLETYLLARVIDQAFCWSDVLGKHSEVDCQADDFDVRLDFNDDWEATADDCEEKWNEVRGLADSTLILAVADRVKAIGPCLPTTQIDWDTEIQALSRTKKLRRDEDDDE